MLAAFNEHRPSVYGMVMGGQYHPVDSLRPTATAETPGGGMVLTDIGVNARSASDAGDRVVELLREEESLVLKWKQGGNNVHLCTYEDGDALSRIEFEHRVAGLEEYLICEFVEQADFGARLYPETP